MVDAGGFLTGAAGEGKEANAVLSRNESGHRNGW